MPVIITRASNNYGPYQYPEKLIPLFATNAIDGLPLPLYGDGRNVRDWLFVRDHAAAIDFLLDAGRPGETYNIAGGNEAENIEITRRVLAELGKPETPHPLRGRPSGPRPPVLARRVEALAAGLHAGDLRSKRAWSETIRWYRDHEEWWRPIKERDAAYREFYRSQYGQRLATSSSTAKSPG